jgi:hypothetical protein
VLTMLATHPVQGTDHPAPAAWQRVRGRVAEALRLSLDELDKDNRVTTVRSGKSPGKGWRQAFPLLMI